MLDSVDERHVGIASGVNNGVSRVAGLLAIAVLGAVISASFGSTLDDKLGAAPLSARRAARGRRRQGKAARGAGNRTAAAAEATGSTTAAADASTSAFHLGIGIAGILMIAGGIVAGLGIENPRRRVEAVPTPRRRGRRRVRPRRPTATSSTEPAASEPPSSEPA